MAQRRKDLNFLGLEMNKKLVRCCLDSVRQNGICNGYFIATNATTTFRSIVSSYPGKLVLVSVQCPNPDFNDPEHRWRMLQRSLIEAVVDLLVHGGKVFLQSDVEAVAVRMKELFLKYGRGLLAISNDRYCKDDEEAWLEENPFGVRSDWEKHVIDRKAPMILSFPEGIKCNQNQSPTFLKRQVIPQEMPSFTCYPHLRCCIGAFLSGSDSGFTVPAGYKGYFSSGFSSLRCYISAFLIYLHGCLEGIGEMRFQER